MRTKNCSVPYERLVSIQAVEPVHPIENPNDEIRMTRARIRAKTRGKRGECCNEGLWVAVERWRKSRTVSKSNASVCREGRWGCMKMYEIDEMTRSNLEGISEYVAWNVYKLLRILVFHSSESLEQTDSDESSWNIECFIKISHLETHRLNPITMKMYILITRRSHHWS
jgi:hypothetical protein